MKYRSVAECISRTQRYFHREMKIPPHWRIILEKKTQEAYRKLAKNFYSKRLGGQPPTPHLITRALTNCAYAYRPAYFRRLRDAIKFDQLEKGFKMAAIAVGKIKNPLTDPESQKSGIASLIQIKPKRQHVKKVSKIEASKLFGAAEAKKDYALSSAIKIAYVTGCRPDEMETIKILGNNMIFIEGSKKTYGVDGQRRGLDRVIKLPPEFHNGMKTWLHHLLSLDPGEGGRMNKIQCRLKTLTKNTFPRRKHQITLKSFRHQKGSDLKASGMSRVEIAYLMGHMSTKSVEVYGSRRSGGRLPVPIEPGISIDEMKSLIEENHKPNPFTSDIEEDNAVNKTRKNTH